MLAADIALIFVFLIVLKKSSQFPAPPDAIKGTSEIRDTKFNVSMS